VLFCIDNQYVLNNIGNTQIQNQSIFEEREAMARVEQIPRQWRLLRRLEAHRFGLSANDLATEEECPVRTIYRDLEALQEAGFPLIQERRGKHSLWKLAFSRDAPKIPFNFTEVCSLWLGRASMLFWQDSELYDSINSAFEKIRATLAPGLLEHFEEFSDKILVRGREMSSFGVSQMISDINHALTSNETIEITYYSPNQQNTTRRKIDPYRLLIQDNVGYLIAYCHLRKDIRTFHLSRIQDLVKTGEFFEEHPDFELDTLLESSFRKMGGEVMDVEILVDNQVRHVVEEQIFHPTQKLIEQPDGSVLLRFRSGGLEEIRSWVLSFGSQAEVIKPQTLRKAVIDSLQEAVNRYQNISEQAK
jgi:proteasome accessory factor B